MLFLMFSFFLAWSWGFGVFCCVVFDGFEDGGLF